MLIPESAHITGMLSSGISIHQPSFQRECPSPLHWHRHTLTHSNTPICPPTSSKSPIHPTSPPTGEYILFWGLWVSSDPPEVCFLLDLSPQMNPCKALVLHSSTGQSHSCSWAASMLLYRANKILMLVSRGAEALEK